MWPAVRLGDVTTKIRSGATPRGGASGYTNSRIALIRSQNVLDNSMTHEGLAHISDEAAMKLANASVEKDDVLLNITGDSVARCCVMEEAFLPARVNQHVSIIRTESQLDPRFLQRALVNPEMKNHLLTISSGGTRNALTKSMLENLEVPLPPLPEQQAIAEVLGALDDKIAANRALVATIGDLMVAEVADLPLTGALTDLCNLTKKVTTTDEMPERVWHYSLPAFDEHGLPNHEASTDIKSNKFVVTKPSVLLSKLNPRFPRVWDIPDPESGAVASTEFLVLEPNKFSTSVLWSLLAHPRVSRFLAEHAAGTSGSHQRVKPSEVMELSMPTDLPASLQEELTSLGLRAESAKRESATLAALRDTLLPALMDGTLRVKDAERTVSEAL
ncbi:restriction endonuclease subunit S [Cutibacterium avidum]|uniref:Type I restriction modification DNA specificity domain-containing protein n=1 Tax=Cutibacterium avidum TaxID=33010 RepID=A0A3E2DKY1_9ACTN|nr:restriction endonuclease subunit S [Cutibacterium avidum]RFT45948.1 hypothetical protein CHT91_03860 [Cutibacterium avidum]TMT51199.1 hypothetical protein DMY01_06620 [Cutibacterium avidum]